MLDIIQILSVRSSYDRFRKAVPDHTLSKEARQIVNDLREYFDTFPEIEVVDWDEFESWFCVLKHSSYKEDALDVYRAVLKNLKEFTVSGVTEDIVLSFIEKDFATRIIDLAERVESGEEVGKLADVSALLAEYDQSAQIIEEESDDILEGGIEQLLSDTYSVTGGLNWRMSAFRKSLGPINKGNFVIISKRPEAGGTTIAASEVTHLAKQLPAGKKVFWFNNEEAGTVVKTRIVQAALGLTKADIDSDKAAADAAYLKYFGGEDKVLVISPASLSTSYIDKLLKDRADEVGLIVFDQLYKVHHDIGKSSNEVQRLAKVFLMGREWAKKYAPTIAIHQSDGQHADKKYAPMEALYGSKTAVQGEADVIVMMGNTDEAGLEHTRFLNIVKNKLPGDSLTDENLRHGKFEVKIKPTVARFED